MSEEVIYFTVDVLMSFSSVHYFAVSAVAEAEAIVREAVEQSSNPHHLGVTCTAGIYMYM